LQGANDGCRRNACFDDGSRIDSSPFDESAHRRCAPAKRHGLDLAAGCAGTCSYIPGADTDADRTRSYRRMGWLQADGRSAQGYLQFLDGIVARVLRQAADVAIYRQGEQRLGIDAPIYDGRHYLGYRRSLALRCDFRHYVQSRLEADV